MEYSHKAIEKKWQNFWEKNKTFKTTNKHLKKAYILDMFPYPSGAGLHVGHPKGYSATDVYARFKRMNGYDVLHPIGWDAFGLPAEQYALKTGKHPESFTLKNIDNFRIQLKKIGLSFDFDKEINTSNSNYYKVTQFMFKKIYENDLAEIKEVNVNWCPELGTVLANEEVLNQNGKMVSERGNFPVIKKSMKQWVIKITKYSKRLLEGLEKLDWPQSVKKLQKNWIGESKGLEVTFEIFENKQKLNIFTTRPDTIFGVTYIAVAPEHKILNSIVKKNYKIAVEKFCKEVMNKTDLDRQNDSKIKSGIFSGSYAIHPITKKQIPIYIADYVLPYYATGILMGVPGHDERDFLFAKKYKLSIIYVIENNIKFHKPVLNDGKHINSYFINGLNTTEAKDEIIKKLKAEKLGIEKTYYRLKDWLFSRQRYWGEPFPIIYWEDGSITLLKDEELPLKLPKTNNIKPSNNGKSPLVNCTDWVNVISDTGLKGKRETNTMPQWAASCWYYIAYILIDNNKMLDITSTKAQKLLKKWLPVDLYVGGQEHAVLHLLYARFWHKFLFDIKLVPYEEPFKRLINQGMILGPDGNKMSKSKGNVINPDNIISSHGADALRLYELFMGPLKSSLAWNFKGLDGTRKWLDRIYRFYKNHKFSEIKNNNNLDIIYNNTIINCTKMIENLEFNTAISQLMTLLNAFYKEENVYVEYARSFIKMISPFVPHLAEEIWELIGNNDTITYVNWPKPINTDNKINSFTVIVQINGKLKTKLILSKNIIDEELKKIALKSLNEKKILIDKKIKNTIIISNKLINFVI